MLRRGFALEYATLVWNVAGIVVLGIAAISARSVALAGFALDSLIEIGASTVLTCGRRQILRPLRWAARSRRTPPRNPAARKFGPRHPA